MTDTVKEVEKLTSGQKHILRLIDRDKDANGYTFVSETLCHSVSTHMPTELVMFEKLNTGGRAKLTEAGNEVVRAMKWL